MYKGWFVAVVGTLLVTGCGHDDLEAGRERIRYVLKDGASAQFRGETHFRRDDRDIYCGEVNAKNGFGAYDGFSRYIVLGSVVVLEGEAPISLPANEKSSGGDNSIREFKAALVRDGDMLDIQEAKMRLKSKLLDERLAALKSGGDVPPQPSESDYERQVTKRLVGELTDDYCKKAPPA